MSKLLILFLVFIFSFSLRFWNLNEMGRTWDEPEYVEQGYKMVDLMKNLDFDNPYFYTTYDHPPLVKYLYGLAARYDVVSFDKNKNPLFRYDFTYSRLLSVFVSSVSVVLVVLVGWEIASFSVGITAGIILAMLPVYLGYSQLVTTESFVMLTFTSSFYSFLLFLRRYSLKWLFITGIMTGIALQVKQSDALLFPLFLLTYVIWYLRQKGKKKHFSFFIRYLRAIFFIFIISVCVFVSLWPQAILHYKQVYKIHQGLWSMHFSPKIWQITLSPPEVFFGRLMLTPIFYYPVYFLITTPFFILCFFLVGLKAIDKRKEWRLYALFVWFALPFILSFYSWRQHGIRYIIEIYAPLSLISAIGLDILISKLTNREILKVFLHLSVIVYLLLSLLRISPYYLDYFNVLVGGTNGVYEKRMFQLGWWGEGIKAAGVYVEKHAKQGSKIGLAVSPMLSVPPMPKLNVKKYRDTEAYDYVIVNYYNILRERFDDSSIRKNYKPVFFVKADNAVLATVYQKK